MSKRGTSKKPKLTADRTARGAAYQTPKQERGPAKASDSFDWSAFDALTDEDIARAVAEDPDAAPIRGDDFWKNAKVVYPVPKQAISIRLDEDVLAYFKEQGPGYQSRINAVLRSYVETINRTRRALIEGEKSGLSDLTPEGIRETVKKGR